MFVLLGSSSDNVKRLVCKLHNCLSGSRCRRAVEFKTLLCNEIECLHLRHGLVSYPDERPYWRCSDVNNYMDCMVNVMLMMLFY